MYLRLAATCLTILAGAGCHSPRITAVSWRTHLDLQPVSALQNPPEFALHEITLDYKGNSFSFIGQVEFSENQLTMAGFTPSGLRLFLIQFNDEEILFEANAMLPKALKGRFILGDFQTIFWPVESLRKGGLSVDEPEPGIRIIYRNEKPVIEIIIDSPGQPWTSEIAYINHPRKLKIRLKAGE